MLTAGVARFTARRAAERVPVAGTLSGRWFAFGGADMKNAGFITTTRENMSAQEVADYPLSGAIFTSAGSRRRG